MKVYDAHLDQERELNVILTTVMGDAPARKKASAAGAANSVFCC